MAENFDKFYLNLQKQEEEKVQEAVEAVQEVEETAVQETVQEVPVEAVEETAQETAIQETVREAPVAEASSEEEAPAYEPKREPLYEENFDNQYHGYTGHVTKKPKKEPKEKKPLGGLHVIAISTAVALVVGIFGSFGGALIANRLTGGNTQIGGGTAVLYKNATVKNDKGETVEGEMSVNALAEFTKPSVVEITTEAVTTGSFMMQYVTEGAGSGVILTTDGYIVTNNHVVSGATKVSVRTSDGKSYDAKIVGADEKSDLAVVKIEGENLTPAVMGDFSVVEVGDEVVAVGNPLGQLGGTVTKGIVSALDREISIEGNMMTLLQTDTAINPGNSGGGLFNMQGQLVGVVNAKSSGSDIEGLGFAIPIDDAQTVINDLIACGYVTGRVETGIEVIEINDYQTAMIYRVSEAGLYVYSVTNDSKAEKAGFNPGDLIKQMDGKEISTEDDYNKIIDSHAIGDVIEVVVSRSGRSITLHLELVEYTPTGASSTF